VFFSPHCCMLGGRAFGPPLCRGCAPATPPTKPSLTRCVPSSQRVGWRAWRRLYTSCVTKSLNDSKDDWLVNYCGLVVTCNLSSRRRKL